jgi:hypothetical protein
VETLLRRNPEGPLSKALLRAEGHRIVPSNVGKAEYWKAHPEIFDAGHAKSASARDRDVLVIMSKWQNQGKFSANVERTGDMLLDEAYVIQGFAVHRGTAWDLVDKGLLDRAVVENAERIPLAL